MQAIRSQEIITIHSKTGRNRTGTVSRLYLIPAPLGNPALRASLAWNLQFLANANHGFSVQPVNRNQFSAIHAKCCGNPTSRIPGTYRVLHRTPSAGFGRQHSEPSHMVGPTFLAFWQMQTVAIRNKAPAMPDEPGQSRVECFQLGFCQTEDALHAGNRNRAIENQGLVLERPAGLDITKELFLVTRHMPRGQETCVEVLDRHLEFARAVMVDHPHVIGAHFLDGPTHSIDAVIVRSNHKRTKVTL